MVVGRPREFDREVALEKAMETFWAKGYEAASVQDLLDAMGINRGSMYDTFGDKHALLVAAFEHYIAGFGERWKSVLDREGSPLGNIRTLLEQVAQMATDRRRRGCMVTNCAIELAASDPVIARELKGVVKNMSGLVRRTLNRARDAGELAPDANIPALTRFVVGAVQGLIVLGKAGQTRMELDDIVDVAISALK